MHLGTKCIMFALSIRYGVKAAKIARINKTMNMYFNGIMKCSKKISIGNEKKKKKMLVFCLLLTILFLRIFNILSANLPLNSIIIIKPSVIWRETGFPFTLTIFSFILFIFPANIASNSSIEPCDSKSFWQIKCGGIFKPLQITT